MNEGLVIIITLLITLFFSSIIFVGGIVCLIWGMKWHHRIKTYQQTTGIILSNHMNLSCQVRYSNEHGDTYHKKLGIYNRADAKRKKVENKVKLIYNPDHHLQVYDKINAYKAKYILLTGGCLIILFSLVSGIYLYSLAIHFQDIQQTFIN